MGRTGVFPRVVIYIAAVRYGEHRIRIDLKCLESEWTAETVYGKSEP